jgi:hypothetical protein
MTNPKIQKLAQYIFKENPPKQLASVFKDNFAYSFLGDRGDLIFTSQNFGRGLVFYYTSPDQGVIKDSLSEEDLKDHNIDRNYEFVPTPEWRLDKDPIWFREKI